MARVAVALASLGLAATADVARAELPRAACPSSLRVEPGLPEPWLRAVESLCAALSNWKDIDTTARIHLTPAGGGVLLEVVTSDGRSAERHVSDPDDLDRSVAALLMVPAASEPTALPAASPAPTDTPTTADASSSPPTPPDASSPAAGADASLQRDALSFEFGGAFLARVEGAPTYVSASLELYAGLRPGPWLFALEASWEPWQVATTAPNDLEMSSIGGGLFVSREVYRTERFAAELGMDLTVVAQSQSYRIGNGDERTDTDADILFGPSPRVLFGPGPVWCFVSLELEVSLLRLHNQVRVAPGLPALPSWSAGLGVGIAVRDP